MKRKPATNEAEWQIQMKARQKTAAIRMLTDDLKKGFVTLKQLGTAAKFWGVNQHLAETRLITETIPDELIELFLSEQGTHP